MMVTMMVIVTMTTRMLTDGVMSDDKGDGGDDN
jgi:hypothetical protein